MGFTESQAHLLWKYTLAKIVILPSIATGQKGSKAAVPLPFHCLNP